MTERLVTDSQRFLDLHELFVQSDADGTRICRAEMGTIYGVRPEPSYKAVVRACHASVLMILHVFLLSMLPSRVSVAASRMHRRASQQSSMPSGAPSRS